MSGKQHEAKALQVHSEAVKAKVATYDRAVSVAFTNIFAKKSGQSVPAPQPKTKK